VDHQRITNKLKRINYWNTNIKNGSKKSLDLLVPKLKENDNKQQILTQEKNNLPKKNLL
jgi:hypothetical protein